MPNQERFQGTRADHFEALERYGRRCDANGRMCVNAAGWEFLLVAADGQGNPLPDAQRERKKSCSRHRLVFGRSGNYCVLEEKSLRQPPQAKAS